MVDATQSACINHPGIEAVVRCKQCGTPVCKACVKVGPTGQFCSDICNQKHQQFTKRAQSMNTAPAPSALGPKIRAFVTAVAIVAGVIVVVGIIASFIEIPVISNITFRVRELIGV